MSPFLLHFGLQSRDTASIMTFGPKWLLSLALPSLWAGSGLVRAGDAHISASSITPPDFCFSSPLLAAQIPPRTWQCSSSSSTTTANTTADSSAQESSSDEESSGGWSGPHACAGTYCVYSNPSFAAHRGIVIISNGHTANVLANLPIFVELAGPGSADLLKAANVNVQAPGLETRDIPGKGRGLVTTRALHRGEQILAYTPALVVRRSFVDDLGRAEQLRLLRDAVRRLPAATRVAFWRQLGQTHQPGDDDVLEIVMNNSFNLQLAAAGFVGNFPEVSMYNHDCRPNVAFHLEHGLIHRTHAVRRAGAILPGEELSISYVDSFRARDVRRARTKRNWGFECSCAQCTLPGALVNASDNRLWRIYEVENALLVDAKTKPAKLKKGETRADDLDAVELLLSLYEQERLLESHGSSAYKVAALNYNAFQKRELAIKYALRALEAYILEDGATSEGVRDMVALLDEPEGHWSWGRKGHRT